jgi:hypothetical protein
MLIKKVIENINKKWKWLINKPKYFIRRHPFKSLKSIKLIRFVECPRKNIACGACGKKQKNHWTLIVPFQVPSRVGEPNINKVFPALTPVCEEHDLLPILKNEKEEGNYDECDSREFWR